VEFLEEPIGPAPLQWSITCGLVRGGGGDPLSFGASVLLEVSLVFQMAELQ